MTLVGKVAVIGPLQASWESQHLESHERKRSMHLLDLGYCETERAGPIAIPDG